MGGTSNRRELACKDGATTAHDGERIGQSTELNLRLWTHAPIQERPQDFSWKSDYVPIHMISDLVAACNGVLLPGAEDRLAARFESPQTAIAAAKRIQWALLGFFQDQPTQPVAAAILVDTASGTGSALAAAKPAQILVAEAVYEQFNGVPGLEFRAFDTEGGVYELVWAAPDTYRLWEQALNPPPAPAPVPKPAENTRSATRILQSPVRLAASGREPANQPVAALGQASESSNSAGLPANDLPGPASENGKPGTNFRSSRGRQVLLAIGVLAILAAALIWMSVHKNAAARQTADQPIGTSEKATAAPVAQPAVAAPRPPEAVGQTATALLPAAPPAEKSAAPAEPKDSEDGSRGRDAQRDRKAQRERKERSAIAANTDDSQPSAKKPDEKAGGNCRLLDNEVSAYLSIADKNRAAGKYADAAREYSAVIECDRHNARAQEGMAKIKQARAVAGTDDSE